MKILFINNFFSNYGGAEKIFYSEATMLRKKGHEIYFFSTNKKPYIEPDYKYTDYFPEYLDYNSATTTKRIKKFFRPIYNFEAEKKLNLFIKEIKPDIVHCHNIHYHLTSSVINACKKNDIPIVMTLHDPKLLCPAGTLRYRTENYCKDEICIGKYSIQCFLNKCKKKSAKASFIANIEYIFSRFSQVYNNVSQFICPSNALLELAVRSGIPENKLTVINNYIDNSYLNYEPEYTEGDYFLYVGRLAKEKGIDILLDSMKKVPTDIKLHIVGTGPEEERLKQQALALNLHNVEFLGYKDNRVLEEEYRNCIAIILPCNWFENFPITIIESYSFGKPVIGSAVGGIPEMLQNNRNGILVPPNEPESLTAAILKLFNNRNLALSMGKNGREDYIKYYNQEIHLEKLLNLYSKLLSC